MTSNSTSTSSPIKRGHSPSQKASHAVEWLRETNAVTQVPSSKFSTNSLPVGQSPDESSWTEEQQVLVQNIHAVKKGHEEDLYMGSVPLLCLCNAVSKSVLRSLADESRTALVFYSSHNKHLVNPFSGSSLAPDTQVPSSKFSTNSLPVGQSPDESSWTEEQQVLVQNIHAVKKGHEEDLYMGSVPLLCLCNAVSKSVLRSLADESWTALVFYSSHNKHLVNPFSGSSLAPDIIVVHEKPEVWERLLGSPGQDPPDQQNWSSIAAIGEAKVDKDAKYQTANYLRNQLQLRPDLHSVIGFSANTNGYSLFYHDANVIHQSSKKEWTPGPLHAFVRIINFQPMDLRPSWCIKIDDDIFVTISAKPDPGLGQRRFTTVARDPSIINFQPMDLRPSWCIKIDDDIFVTISAKPDPGLGQRRFTTVVKHVKTSALWFIKDIYRDDCRRFFEGILYDKAHKDQALHGLMYADRHGFVLDENENVFKTASSKQGASKREPTYRSKMRVVTQDIGQALSTLGEFLVAMYDACVVQRNLYRKSKILHRDTIGRVGELGMARTSRSMMERRRRRGPEEESCGVYWAPKPRRSGSHRPSIRVYVPVFCLVTPMPGTPMERHTKPEVPDPNGPDWEYWTRPDAAKSETMRAWRIGKGQFEALRESAKLNAQISQLYDRTRALGSKRATIHDLN
ncbi:hypothetical protein RSAG8_11747, partial [Rhizoctonia solani AG-8 WAC10335]